MKNAKIISSTKFDHDGKPHWRIQMEAEINGKSTRFSHCFPEDIFVFRVAEYGFDPSDIDTMLDVILTEPHAVVEPGTHLYELQNRDEAKKVHMARCAQKKLSMRLSTRPNKSVLKAKAANPDDPTTDADVDAEHPLDNLRNHFNENPLDPRDVSYCRDFVDTAFRFGGNRNGNKHNKSTAV
jgi:hypothetical protein